jgi:dienelactone hydrolase
VLAKQGQLYGNADRGHVARVTNGRNFSYPGYNEILSGRADARIDSNDKKPNPNVTVLEWLNKREAYNGRVAAFCSWDVFPWILNRERSGLVVNAGFEPMTFAGDGGRLAVLNQLLADTTPAADGVRHDSLTYAATLEYVRAARPRVLYISYGETDDWAHAGRYDHYLHSAQRFDRFVRQLWDEMQRLDQYRGKTTFVITTDHGRGRGLTGWKSHGEKIPESENIWIGVLGPDTPARWARTPQATSVTQSQVAATVAAALGENSPKAMPGVAAPIAGAIRSAAGSLEVNLDRARLMELLGRTPSAPPPVAAERVETADLGDVVREKVTYAVEAAERVPAYVFVPQGQGPFPRRPLPSPARRRVPGRQGRAGGAGLDARPALRDRARAARLRHHRARRAGLRRAPGLGRQAQGRELRAVRGPPPHHGGQVSPGQIRLGRAARPRLPGDAPEVDRARIGMIGHSLGGQETLFTTAADTRIRAAVSSCGFGSLRVLERDRILHNFALFVPGLAEAGDYGAVLALVAPRPFLVAARSEDPIFPMEGIEETVSAGRAAYAAAGASDRLATFYEPGPHQFSPAMREAAYAWLDRWLKPETK